MARHHSDHSMTVALWIELTVILNWRYGMVLYGLVWLCCLLVVWGGCQMTSEFIHEDISIMDYNGLS